MAFYKHNSEVLPERRGVLADKLQGQSDYSLRNNRRGRRFGRISGRRLLIWVLSLSVLFSIYLSVFGFNMLHVNLEAGLSSLREVEGSSRHVVVREVRDQSFGDDVSEQPRKKLRRQRFSPCEVSFLDSVNYFVEPKDLVNITKFSVRYVEREERPLHDDAFKPRFGGHQTLEKREESFYARNHTMHCGFVQGPQGFQSTGFDLDKEDKKYMNSCSVAVSSCIFGSSDFLRRPTSKLISDYSKRNVCFVIFVDEQTLSKLSSEGNVPDDRGYVGLWKIVVVRNLPYKDLWKTGKVPKFLSHHLFPSSRYSMWIDSKLRLVADPMLIIEYFCGELVQNMRSPITTLGIVYGRRYSKISVCISTITRQLMSCSITISVMV